MKVLILKLTAMGDILQTLPAIRQLVMEHPGVRIDWLVKPEFADVLQFFPCVDKVFLFEHKKLKKYPGAFREWALLYRNLGREKYDQIIDLQGQFRLAWLGRRLAPGRLRGSSLNSDWGARFCYNSIIQFDNPLTHRCDQYRAVVNNVAVESLKELPFEAPAATKFDAGAKKVLEKYALNEGKGLLIGVIVGANWASRMIDPEFFASYIRRMRQRIPGAQLLLLGAPKERAHAERVVASAGTEQLHNLCGETSMGEMIELIRHLDLVLSSDTGPLHAAVAMGTPSVSLFGAFPAELTAPRSRFDRVLDAHLPCGGCRLKVCGFGDNRCLKAIKAEDAVEASMALLQERGALC